MIGVENCTVKCECKDELDRLKHYISATTYRNLVHEDEVLDCKKALEVAMILIEGKRLDY